MTLHFLNDEAKGAEATFKIENYVMIASLKSETMGKLKNRIPGSRLLISSLPGSALRTLVESPSLVNLISKDANLVFYLSVYPLLNTLQTSDYDLIFDFCVDSASLATPFKKCNVILT